MIKVSAASDEFLDVLGKILAELGKNGSNLNQIAKVLNEFHAPYDGLGFIPLNELLAQERA